MSAHTPGPWNMQTAITSCGLVYKIGPFPGKDEKSAPRHACLYADYPSKFNPADDELEANARLIAAAPELLEFVQEWLARQGTDQNYMATKARAAIAKAT